MKTPPKDNPKQTICVISVVLQDVTDDLALGVKKKIDAVLVDIPDHRVDFRIMTGQQPTQPSDKDNG
ncbi:hypothetical protein LCGC14_0974910 [marine sediment metagenome]|uniref:Uncharacterized protein n=1 Tax=marine sediment metagenome TaxID=412755 RepID=A0A0F9NAH0_9ZZZZ